MKKKSIFKRLSSLLIVMLMAVSVFSDGLVSFAADSKNTEHILYGWGYNFSNSGLANAYDPLTGEKTNDAFNYKWAQEFFYWTDSNGNYCYCVQLGTDHEDSAVMSSITFNDNAMVKLYSDRNQRERVRAATIYAYKGKSKYGYSGNVELVASQAMIWAVSGGYFDSSSESLSTNESSLLGHIIAPTNGEHKDLINCYKKMKGDILSHLKIPSGTSIQSRTAPTYELKYNPSNNKFEGTIKSDSNLAQFDFSTLDGVTFQKSGNNIKVTATAKAKVGTHTITMTKTKAKNSGKIEDCVPLVFQTKDNSTKSQMKVGYISGKDPVQAYFKLKISTGSAHLDKSFTDYFGNKQTGTADMYKAVKFQLACKVGDSYKFVKATGKDGSYSFTDLASQATDLTPNGKGDIDVTGLPEGDYEWREISTADGYMISSKKAITVTADKTAKTEFVNKASAPDKGKITIHKRDAETRADLAGAKFEVAAAEDIFVGNGYCIYPKGTVIDTITTGADGIAETTKAIYKGYSYTVTEIEAPKGYSISDEPTQTIKLVEQQAEFVVDFENEQNTIPFEITKTDISTGELIPDCTFEILNENKEQVITGTTDENGIAHFQLAIGKYFYREISAPDIYEIDDTPYQFEITENDDIVKAEMTNKKKSGSIKVTKTTTGNLNIEGIKFFATGISDTNKDLKFEATTDENGVAMFDKLVIGKYVITEDGSTVPAAYLVADEQEVTVDYNETAEVAFENIEKTGSIVVHKTTEGQRNIEGIRFILSGVSDTGREIRIEAVTDKDGIAKFENVPIGTYTITEDGSTVPYGYLVADEKEVKVEYAQTIDETILNNEQTGTVKVHKKTDGMTNIEGIRFILSGVSDTGREIRIEAVTDKDGIAKFENVPIGTYTITEDGSTVPYGYLVADSKQVTVTYAQTVDADMFNQKVPNTPNTGSSDNDIDGRTVLGGVVVILAGAAVLMFSRKKKER